MIAQTVPVLLAFGANLGDRAQSIRDAQRELGAHEQVTELRVSPLRETIAFGLEGPDLNAPKYLNGVATLVTTLSPDELLALVQRIEHQHGRTREVRWGDRTLDIDIITYGGRVVNTEHLSIPHPAAHERDFVLAPWLALDPNAVLMGHGRVVDVLERLGDTTAPFDGSDPRDELS